MAKMPDALVINVVAEPVTQQCLDEYHNFTAPPVVGDWLLLYCRNCAMIVDVRFDDASRS